MGQDALRLIMREGVKEDGNRGTTFCWQWTGRHFCASTEGVATAIYLRRLGTAFGSVELALPQGREGRRCPTFLTPYARRQVDVDLERVLLFVTEGLSGIEGAMRRACPQGAWQRCVVHQMRGSPGQVKAQDRALVGQELKRVYKAEGRGSLLPWRG